MGGLQAGSGQGVLEVFFLPAPTLGHAFSPEEVVELYPEELEALKLVYIEELQVEEAAARMGLSKATLWRILDSGRRKVVEALVQLKPLKVVLPGEPDRKA
uniref:DUF134 domain-containing protein n=1 Tax=Thermofilum pendens TaxID=2269 RepID=A0A7C3WJL8_THEPE